MVKLNTSRSVRSSLLISYVVILMIPILFHFIIFFINIKNLQKQSDLIFTTTNEQLTDFINTYVEEVHMISSAIILSDDSQNLMNYTTGKQTTYQINYFRRLQKELSYKTIVCDYISGIYVIFPKSHTILTENSIYYDYNFTYKCRYSLGMTLDEWQNFISFDGYERVSILHGWLDGKDHILVAQKNRSTHNKTPEMLVVTEISVDSIHNILNELSMDGRLRTLLYDRKSGTVLSSNLSGSGSSVSYEIGKGEISADRAIISKKDTDQNNWQCVLLTPRSTYFSSFISSFIGMAVYLIVCTIVGIWVIRYMTQKQYTPLEKLTKSLLSTMEQNSHSTEANEYEQIEEALTLLLHKHTSDQEEDMLLHQSFTENILRSILSGHIHKDSIIYRHAVNNGIVFDSDLFLVMLYSIEDIDNTLYQIEDEYDNVMVSLMDTIVCAAAQDFSDAKYKRYAVKIDNQIACIICCPTKADSQQIFADMQRDSNWIRGFLSNKFGFVISTVISNLHEGVENISACYEEAKETSEYMETMGLAAQTFLYSSIPEKTSNPIAFSSILEKERQFCNCIKAYDFPASKQLLQEIITSFDLNHCSAPEARLRVYGLISVISSALAEVRPLLSEEQERMMNPDYFLHTKDVNVLCRQTEQLLDQLSAANIQQQKSFSSSRENMLVQYVDEHITDPNLNISVIADSFDMSPSYFSRIFKKTTGVGLLDYIHQHRIELAKELMQQAPPLPLKDIAEKIGYATPLAMNRAFRRYEGVSPSSFREHIQQQNI